MDQPPKLQLREADELQRRSFACPLRRPNRETKVSRFKPIAVPIGNFDLFDPSHAGFHV
jgi:hypothetical protein